MKVLLLLSLLVWPSLAGAEVYLTAMGGWNMPGDFTGFHAEYSWQGRQFEDALKLQNGGTFGGKLGYSPKALPWLAIELEGNYSFPNQKEQSYIQFARPPSGSGAWQISSGNLPGTRWKMLSVGPNVLLRHRINEQWMVYSGAGVPVFIGGSYGGAEQVPGAGVKFLAGLRYTLNEAGTWRVLVEANRTYAKLTYKQFEMDGQVNGFTGHYETTQVLFGIERTFNW